MNEIDILQESEYLDVGNEFLDLNQIRRYLNVLKSFHLDEKSKIKNIKIQFNNSAANLYFNLFQNFKTSISKRIIETFFANNTKNIWIIKIDINLDKQTYDALEAYSFLEDMDWFYKINIVVQLKLLQVFDKLNLHETCKFILSSIEFANDKNFKNEDFAYLMLDIFKVTNFKDENNLCNNNVIGLIKNVMTLIANNTSKRGI